MIPKLADFTADIKGLGNSPLMIGKCAHSNMRKAPARMAIDACPDCGRMAFASHKKWEWSAGFVTVPFSDESLMNAAMACAFKPVRERPTAVKRTRRARHQKVNV